MLSRHFSLLSLATPLLFVSITVVAQEDRGYDGRQSRVVPDRGTETDAARMEEATITRLRDRWWDELPRRGLGSTPPPWTGRPPVWQSPRADWRWQPLPDRDRRDDLSRRRPPTWDRPSDDLRQSPVWDRRSQIRVEGRLMHGVAAVGGETTGAELHFNGFNGARWELDFGQAPHLRILAEHWDGRRVFVEGTVRTQEGVEVPGRTIMTALSMQPVWFQRSHPRALWR